MTQAASFTLFSAVLVLAYAGAIALGVQGISWIAVALDRNLQTGKLIKGFIALIVAVVFAVNAPTLVSTALRPLMPALPTNRAAALRYCESHIYSRFIACMESLNFSVTSSDR